MRRIPTLKEVMLVCAGTVLAGFAFQHAVRRPAPPAAAAASAVPLTAAGDWAAEPRRVPLAQATAADFDAAFVYARIPSILRPQLALLAAADGQTHDRVIELDARDRWRELPRMTQLAECEAGAFVADADRRWFGWRAGAATAALPAAVWHIGPCSGDIGQAAMRSEGNVQPPPRWYALDGREFASQPTPAATPLPKPPPATAWKVDQALGVQGLVDAQGRWLTARAPASAFEPWALTPALREEAARVWAQGPQMIDREGRAVQHLSPGETPARFVDGLWAVPLHPTQWRLATPDGRWLGGPTQGLAGFAPSEGLAAAQTPDGRAWGYLGRDGQWAIAPRFAEAQPFEGGVAAVRIGDGSQSSREALIDRQGRPVEAAPPPPNDDLVEGLQRIGVDGRWGYADAQGRTVIAPRFTQAEAFSQGLAAVQIEGRWGYVDKRGTLVIAAVFDEVAPFAAGVPTWVRQAGQARLIDRDGKPLAIEAPPVADLRPMVDGRAAAMSADGNWGFIDPQGRWVVPPTFAQVGDFENGFAWVKPTPATRPACLTRVAAVLGDGRAALQRCHRYALIDEAGRLLIPSSGK